MNHDLSKMRFDTIKDIPCPVFQTYNRVIAGKWKLPIIYLLSNRRFRFLEFIQFLPELNQSTLSKQLKELAAEGLVKRTSYDEIPPKVEYSLTEKGQNFSIVLDAMKTWGLENLDMFSESSENDTEF
jgi:DNA-binding HxlR family transcriptional regulator